MSFNLPAHFKIIPVLFYFEGCESLPDPLTCDPSEPKCQKAERLAEIRAQRELDEERLRAMCPNGILVIDRGDHRCVRQGGFSMNNIMGMPRW